MTKVKLQFMVADLDRVAYVPNRVKIKITDPEAICITGMLGESGRKLVKQGIYFYFTKRLANKLIRMGVAEKVE
jgi:hypothetical protein